MSGSYDKRLDDGSDDRDTWTGEQNRQQEIKDLTAKWIPPSESDDKATPDDFPHLMGVAAAAVHVS